MASLPQDHQNDSQVTLPFVDGDDFSDSEEVSESMVEPGISPPPSAFFLGCRQGQYLDPRALEEARCPTAASSTPTLVGTPDKSRPSTAAPKAAQSSDGQPLPSKKGTRAYRYLRWNFGSVYKRIFTLAFISNIAVIAVLVAESLLGGPQLTYQGAACAVSANLLAGLVVRNEHVVNAMFIVFGTWPKRLPLFMRRFFAKVYSYGGIHSGCSVAATFWYIAFLVLITRDFVQSDVSIVRNYIFLVSYGIICLLAVILIFAHPHLRVVVHNWFEGVHRFLGWTAVLLFWAQNLLLAADAAATRHVPYGAALVTSAPFWMLVCITLLVVYPWTRLRLRDVEAEPLSDHCIKLNFNYRNAHYGQAIRLADAPLKETHAFATIPNPAAEPESEDQNGEKEPRQGLSNAGKKGFSVVISNAGDWTSKIIRNPPKKLYTRGVPQYGVLRVAGMFEPVIVMATGSGIAPCLSLFVEKPDHPVRVIWSTPNPLETFGQGVIDAVYRADPDAIIIDTRKSGRPDLVRIAYQMWEGSRREARRGTDGLAPYLQQPRSGKKALGPCEAVVIISNQKVTRKVVYGLESRGVAAYGAIFDS